eukprot:COSAG03_NODE_10268_length_661_cov_0.943060_1_plen_24_part_01
MKQMGTFEQEQGVENPLRDVGRSV